MVILYRCILSFIVIIPTVFPYGEYTCALKQNETLILFYSFVECILHVFCVYAYALYISKRHKCMKSAVYSQRLVIIKLKYNREHGPMMFVSQKFMDMNNNIIILLK